MMHECRCLRCHDFDLPRERHGEHHVSVRFGDDRLGCWAIEMDERDLTERCVEAFAARPGWVLLHSAPTHLCTCRQDICLERRWGEVTIRVAAPAIE